MLEKLFKTHNDFINTVNSNFSIFLSLFNDLKNYFHEKDENSITETINFNEARSNSKIMGNNIKINSKKAEIILKRNSTTSCIRESESNYYDRNKCEVKELRMLRKESSILRQHISNMIKENSILKKCKEQYDNNLLEFQESINTNNKFEIENVEKQFQIYKQFYDQEIKDFKKIIEDFSIAYDDLLFNIKKDSKGNEILKNYFKDESNRILNNEIKRKSINELAGTLLSEGVATKKLDYVYIEMNKKDEFDIVFGSGINQQIPSKCPLYKNLKFSHKGDNCNDLYTPENTDC